jgi:hypothetical protein
VVSSTGEFPLKKSIFGKLPEVMQVVIALIEKHGSDESIEPEEDIQPGDNIIGPISKEVMYLFRADEWVIRHIMDSLSRGLKTALEEFRQGKRAPPIEQELAEGEPSESAELLHQALNAHINNISSVTHHMLKHAILYDEYDRDLKDKEVEVRKGWIAVWREPEPEVKA